MDSPLRGGPHDSGITRSSTLSMPAQHAAGLARKVPEVTVFFWIIKLLTTAMGEGTSDFLVFQIDPYVAVSLGAVGLVVALILQLSARRYYPAVYWFAALMVAVFGTMAADVVHVEFGVPYAVSSGAFAVALVIIFAGWYISEKTLSIHSIYTLRRELFYWATVMATFALGTALGDMTASTLHLGYFGSGVLFAVLFALPGLAYWRFRINSVFAFWLAYIMTRPFGASFADWTGKAKSMTGLGYGDGPVILVLGILIVAFVVYLTVSGRDARRSPVAAAER